MDSREIMLIEEFDAAIEWQADHAANNGAQCTARIIRALSSVRQSNTELGRRMRNWEGLTLKDAMPLRVTGADERLRPVYSGALVDQAAIDALVLDIVQDHDTQLAPWLDGPPQTNEAGRSASIMAGLLWAAKRVSPRFNLFELGASAGVNTMIDRYFFDLGGTQVGPTDSPMRIVPKWRGSGAPPTPAADFEIVQVKGCDISPIDLANSESALRLKAYVWPDAPERLARIDAAIQLAALESPDVAAADAAEFALGELAKPQAEGTTRAMFHSIMWQYMPSATQANIETAMEKKGAQATPQRPLAWISLETDPATFRHELKVRIWDGSPSSGTPHLLAHAHPHGAWVEWGSTSSH